MSFIKVEKKNTYLIDDNDPFSDILKDLNITNFSLPYPNPTNKIQRSVNAFEKIVLIAKSYNNSWVSNVRDPEQTKYIPYKGFNSEGKWFSYFFRWEHTMAIPSAIHFKSSDLAMKAFKNFEKIYDDYFMI